MQTSPSQPSTDNDIPVAVVPSMSAQQAAATPAARDTAMQAASRQEQQDRHATQQQASLPGGAESIVQASGSPFSVCLCL